MSTKQFHLLVPYDQKDVLKQKYKLSWNADVKLWHCANERIYNLKGILPYHIKYLSVNFNNKDLAKELGCKWDSVKRSWCIAKGIYDANQSKFDALSIVNFDNIIDDDVVEDS
jgi:hypothetical protein